MCKLHRHGSAPAAAGSAPIREESSRSRLSVMRAELDGEGIRSFVPPRVGTRCRFLIDGKAVLGAMHQAITGAKRSIYISFWMITSTLKLRRGTDSSDADRLDHILKAKAEAGVEVCIILWRENRRLMVCVDMCGDMCVDVCVDMRVDMCVCVSMLTHTSTHSHVFRRII